MSEVNVYNDHLVGDLRLMTGSANPRLAEAIGELLAIPLIKSEVKQFADGECRVLIDESLRGREVYVIQPTCPPVNDSLMELLIMVDALKRASARKVNIVCPYFGYSRQDKKQNPREPISAKLVANMMELAGASRVLTMDLHNPSLQGFFDIPVDHLMALPLLAKYFTEKDICGNKTVVVSPDVGGVARARALSERLDCGLAIVSKRREEANVCEVEELIGHVDGFHVVIIDDMIDTAGTITKAAERLKNEGALDVHVCASHGLFSGPAVDRINTALDKGHIAEVVCTDSIPQHDRGIKKMKVLSIAELIAQAIIRGYERRSISELFN